MISSTGSKTIVSNLLDIKATLDLLERLRTTIREFCAKARALRQGRQTQAAAETAHFQAATQQRRARLDERLAALEAELKSARERLAARFEQRQARIAQAHRAIRKRALDEIEQEEGRQKYVLQKRALDAERQRETELARARSQLEQMRTQLLESQQRSCALEQSTQRAFRGVAEFTRLLRPDRAWPVPDFTPDEDKLLAEVRRVQDQTEEALRQFRSKPLLKLFRALPLWLLMSCCVVCFAGLRFILPRYGMPWLTDPQTVAALMATLVFVGLLYWIAKRTGRSKALAIAHDLAQVRHWQGAIAQKSEQRYDLQVKRIKADWEKTSQEVAERWNQALQEAEQQRQRRPREVDERKDRLLEKSARLHQHVLDTLEHDHRCAQEALRTAAQAEELRLTAVREARLSELEREFQQNWQRLSNEWQRQVEPLWTQVQSTHQAAQELFRPWDDPAWAHWTPPETFPQAARFGSLEVDVRQLAELAPQEPPFPFPGPAQFSLPLLLTFPEQGSLLFETANKGGAEAIGAINSTVFRLLALSPPGKVSLTIIDPVGLGQSFAGLMHLADFEESQINSRIWTQTGQIEEKLAELSEHMEKVIQMYLRNEYPTIAEYNAQAGTLAEKYHFLVVAGFPVNFSETAGRRLLNIAASGARCGVFTLIHWDQRHELPHEFIPDELRKNSIRITVQEDSYLLAGRFFPGTKLLLDTPPSPQFATEFLRQIGQSSKDANRVELPFDCIAPAQGERWSKNTAEELRVPIGRSGATKLQELAIGRGTRQHALIAGKTGSGKSTLFHVIITSIALWHSPDEVEFYLVDFKKGVEFKCYATRRLPHARVVAIESDREFGLSVLQRVDDELRRRGELFRNAGVQDLTGYRKAEPAAVLPRLLLLIDEFQEFFTEEDRISQTAAVLLDRIVRQGRAFGIHVILGSQTLGGAYTLARATMGQMVIRIALQCNEADAYLIMDENNAAPRLLSRPGEGIYNDMAGSLEGNSPFQTAWLPDEVRDQYLAEIRAQADRDTPPRPGPLVFEGNAPADVNDNPALQAALRQSPNHPPLAARVWLGAPNSIKGPTEVVFQKQSGNNLLVVGQNEDAWLGIPVIALVSLAAQFPPATVRFFLLDNTVPESRERHFLDRVIRALPTPVQRPKRPELAAALETLAHDVLARTGEEPPEQAPTTFLLIAGLQDFKNLRQEDDFSFSPGASEPGPDPASLLRSLLSDGPSRGCHLIITIDTYTNVTRFFSRRALSEFQIRVLFQMSASDSASLSDNPDASRLGLHRALLFNEREGYFEKFRPYALTGGDWLESVAQCFAKRS